MRCNFIQALPLVAAQGHPQGAGGQPASALHSLQTAVKSLSDICSFFTPSPHPFLLTLVYYRALSPTFCSQVHRITPVRKDQSGSSDPIPVFKQDLPTEHCRAFSPNGY